MSTRTTIVWFRQDLRLEDQPALAAAAGRGGPVIPVFIWSPQEEGPWPPGAAARWWLHHSLSALDRELRRLNSRLTIRRGNSLAELRSLIRQTGADAVFFNDRCEPVAVARDARVKAALENDGLDVTTFNGSLLFAPQDVRTASSGPFRVFTPFWRACLKQPEPEPAAAPSRLMPPPRWPRSCPLDELALLPAIDWAGGLARTWKPGPAGAQAALARFLDRTLADYASQRDRPDLEGTSRLSPHLHWGEISPREVWQAVSDLAGRDRRRRTSAEVFLRELGWREFACHLLVHFPHTPQEPLRPEFSRFPWRRDAAALRAWQRGATGYPIVDAAMRELWDVGWMHNRARMIVASFLVKDLLLPWLEGAKWFWDTLVDADLASNTLGWQWSAGCGADAAPYFRVFNPTAQGRKFDPQGRYIRRWVPPLKPLSVERVHEPWKARLAAATPDADENYPPPILDHAEVRRRALTAFAAMRKKKR